MFPIAPDILKRAKQISLVVLDCDGVLTDGRLYYASSGQDDTRSANYMLAFNAQDGNSMKMLMNSGIEIAVISGRDSLALQDRLKELGVTRAFLNRGQKGCVLEDLAESLGLKEGNVASVGDDIPDLALFERSGLCFAPSDAHPVVCERAHYVTEAAGGKGCVREVAQVIMTAQGKFDAAIDDLTKQ